VDNGGAPCVTPDLLTLAVCKPKTRSAAELGDWIFGFMGNRLGNQLNYIAEVTGKMISGSYYGAKAFHSRPDNIYRWTTIGRLKVKRNPLYHGSSKDAPKDIGNHPQYRKANVLLSTNFRYFGSTECKVPLPEGLAEYIRHVGQNHRSYALKQLRRELRRFRDEVWRKYPSKKKLGQPLHPDDRTNCHGGKCETC
jgi:hypothetical protein